MCDLDIRLLGLHTLRVKDVAIVYLLFKNFPKDLLDLTHCKHLVENIVSIKWSPKSLNVV